MRLAALRDGRLSLDEAVRAVSERTVGAVATFVGLVRDHDGGKGVEALEYSAHPNAEAELRRTAQHVLRPDITAVAVTHRLGPIPIGEEAVVVAVSAAHRGPALGACRELIDTLKQQVPIWKYQRFDDGQEEWVGLP